MAKDPGKNDWRSIGEILAELNTMELPVIESDYFKSLHSLKKFYKANESTIVGNPYKWFISYPVDWHSILTPIELRVWEVIKYTGRVIMYPQYPVLNYIVDFGNPGLKIAIEADGKEFHTDKKKDKARDLELFSAGWRVFRISGSKINYMPEPLYRETVFEEGYDEYQQQWYKSTLEGFIYAIKIIYFDSIRDNEEIDTALQILDSHRLANFPL